MNCLKFERRLQELLDERAERSLRADDLPGPLQNHVAACAGCAELLDGYRSLFAAMAWDRADLTISSPVVVPSLAAPAAGLKPRPSRYRWFRVVVPLASAACVLLATFAVYQGRPSKVAGPVGVPTVQNATVTPLPAAPEINATADARLPRTVFGSPLDIDERSVGLMLNLAGLSPVAFSAELLDLPLVDRPGWMMQVGDGLRPVTERMTGTLNALLQGFPREDAPQDPSHGARYDRANRSTCLG